MIDYDRGIVRTYSISLKEKFVCILMLLMVFAALLVPVAQAAKNRELQVRLANIRTQSTIIEEKKQVLTAQITEAQLPELTLQKASQQGLLLQKILFDDAKIVVVKE